MAESKHSEPPVIVIGAGVSGLVCARTLHRAGIPVRILERTTRVGGRMKTDSVDGFQLDRGFQVLQDAYPEARKQLRYNELNLKPFASGALLRIGRKSYPVTDPFRYPKHIIPFLTAPIGSLMDRWKLFTLRRRVLNGNPENLFRKPEQSIDTYLREMGVSPRLLGRFFKPFFRGVTLDRDLQASSRVLEFVYRMLAEGHASLPAAGIAAIPQQIADDLPQHCLRFSSRCVGLHEKGVWLKTGEVVPARAVVVATNGPAAQRLLEEATTIGSRPVTCLWYAADKPPHKERLLMLNSTGKGRINTLSVHSNIAPSYAPEGKALIGVSMLTNPGADDASVDRNMRDELSVWFKPKDVEAWKLLKVNRIPHALPPQFPPQPDPTTRPELRELHGLPVVTAGEYKSVPSINWAMVSGRLAAEVLIERFA